MTVADGIRRSLAAAGPEQAQWKRLEQAEALLFSFASGDVERDACRVVMNQITAGWSGDPVGMTRDVICAIYDGLQFGNWPWVKVRGGR